MERFVGKPSTIVVNASPCDSPAVKNLIINNFLIDED
jgi:hypothetical protein